MSINNQDEKLDIKIIPLRDLNISEWNCFISKNKYATFFSSTDYLGSFNNVQFILVRNKNNDLMGGLPIIIKVFIPRIGNLFKTCTLESAILTHTSVKEQTADIIKSIILSSLNQYLKLNGIVYCYFTHWVRSTDGQLLDKFGFKREQQGTVTVDLTKDEKEIVRNFKTGYKHALNKAKRLGVEYSIEEGPDAIHQIEQFSMLRLQTQDKAKSKNKNATMTLKSNDFIHCILLAKHFKTYLASASYKNQIAHIVLLVTHNETIYAYLSGSNVKLNKETGAANYLYYKTILFAKEIGLKILDMGGTPINPETKHPAYGVYFFKRSFGGELKVFDGGYMIVKKIRGQLIRKFFNWRGMQRAITSIFKLN